MLCQDGDMHIIWTCTQSGQCPFKKIDYTFDLAGNNLIWLETNLTLALQFDFNTVVYDYFDWYEEKAKVELALVLKVNPRFTEGFPPVQQI